MRVSELLRLFGLLMRYSVEEMQDIRMAFICVVLEHYPFLRLLKRNLH